MDEIIVAINNGVLVYKFEYAVKVGYIQGNSDKRFP